jgi:hypothetical protein
MCHWLPISGHWSYVNPSLYNYVIGARRDALHDLSFTKDYELSAMSCEL